MDDHPPHRTRAARSRTGSDTPLRTAGRSRFRAGRRSQRLDPVRWTPRRRGRLVRTGLVTVLLLLAGGVLLSGAGPAAASRCLAADDGHGAATRPGQHGTTPGAGAPRGRSDVGVADVPDGRLGVPVTVAQPGMAALLHPGDHVQLTAASAGSGRAEIIARDLLVLRTAAASSDLADSSMVYLAMTEDQARRVAALGPDTRLGVAVRSG